jgi:hypothetical protein
MAEAASAAPPSMPQWIVSRRYDLAWFFGGAFASLAVLALYFAAHVPVLVLFWVWTIALDGPHIGAAFTRTYADREEWRSRRRVLLVSLLTFAVGPLFLLLNAVTGSQDPFLLFLGLVTFYAYYHVVRQHYGFLALYKARNRDGDRIDFQVDRAFLYVGCWAPYVYFLLTHPKARVLLRLPPEGPSGLLDRAALVLCLGLWGAALLAFVVRLFARPRERLRQPQTAYLLITVLLYSVVYFFVARFEPAYAQSNGPDQDFLLLSVVTSIFHSIQYLGLVWFHNRNRYGAPSDVDYGPARPINRSIGSYLLVCLIFSAVVYLGSAASTGVFPVFHFGQGLRWGSVSLNQVGLSLWWGIALNHYYLDQKIWRIRGDAQLKKNLGLA